MTFLMYAEHWLRATYADEAALRAADSSVFEDGDHVLVQTIPLHPGKEAIFVWETGMDLDDFPEVGFIRPDAITAESPGRWMFLRFADDVES